MRDLRTPLPPWYVRTIWMTPNGHCHVCHAVRAPRTPSKTIDANLNCMHCMFAISALFTLILDCEKSTEWNWVSDQTWHKLIFVHKKCMYASLRIFLQLLDASGVANRLRTNFCWTFSEDLSTTDLKTNVVASRRWKSSHSSACLSQNQCCLAEETRFFPSKNFTPSLHCHIRPDRNPTPSTFNTASEACRHNH